MIPKVNSGDKLRIRAQDWNAIAQHVNSTRLETTQGGRTRGLYGTHYFTTDLLAGQCVKLDGAAGWSGNDLTEDFADCQVFDLAMPKNGETDCTLAIAQEDILTGDIGRISISGASYAVFSSYDPAYKYAEPDGQGKLKSVALGIIEVVYVDTKTKQGIVIIGGTGGAKGGYFDVRCEKVDGQWQATIFNSGEPERSGRDYTQYISVRVIIGNHTEYIPTTTIPFSGSHGWIYLWIRHDEERHSIGTAYAPYAGLTSGFAFAMNMPEADYGERVIYYPIASFGLRNSQNESLGYEIRRTSHSRGGAIEVVGRWV